MWLVIWNSDQEYNELPHIRSELGKEITDLITEFGPKLFPDLDQNRLFLPDQGTIGAGFREVDNAPLTPSSLSALNWIMSPLDLIAERLFVSGSNTPASSNLTRANSYTDILSALQPLTSLSTSMVRQVDSDEDFDIVDAPLIPEDKKDK